MAHDSNAPKRSRGAPPPLNRTHSALPSAHSLLRAAAPSPVGQGGGNRPVSMFSNTTSLQPGAGGIADLTVERHQNVMIPLAADRRLSHRSSLESIRQLRQEATAPSPERRTRRTRPASKAERLLAAQDCYYGPHRRSGWGRKQHPRRATRGHMDSRAAPPPLGTEPPQAATVPALPRRGATSVAARRYYGGRDRSQHSLRVEQEGAVDLPRDQSAPALRQRGSDHVSSPPAAWADGVPPQRPSVLPGLQQAMEASAEQHHPGSLVASGPYYAAAPGSGPTLLATGPPPAAAAPETEPILSRGQWDDAAAAAAAAPESFAGSAGAGHQRVGFAAMPRAEPSLHAQQRMRRRWATSRLGGRPAEMEEQMGARLRPMTTAGDPAVFAVGGRVPSSAGDDERNILTPFSSSSRPHTASSSGPMPHDELWDRGEEHGHDGVHARAYTPGVTAASNREQRGSQRPTLPLVQAARRSTRRQERDVSPEGRGSRSALATASRTPSLSRRSLIKVPVPLVAVRTEYAFPPMNRRALLESATRDVLGGTDYDDDAEVKEQVARWVTSYDAERPAFHSTEKFIAVKLHEARHVAAQMDCPSPFLAAVVCDMLGIITDELRHRSDARVLLQLHRYLVSTVYPELDIADPALQKQYNAVLTDEDGSVWRRPTRLLFYLGRDPYFVTTEKMKLQLADLADDRAQFYMERKRQMKLHEGMDSVLQRVTSAWRGDNIERLFKLWRDNAQSLAEQRRVVEQLRRTRRKLLAMKYAHHWRSFIQQRRLQHREFEHMRRLEQEEDLKRRIKQARASALGMMEEIAGHQQQQETLSTELEELQERLRKSKTSGHKAMIQSLRNVMIEGTEMLFEFTESALEEEEWLEPFEVVPELAECSCAVYPTLDDGDTASVDDIVAETSSVGTKQSDTQPTRAARPAGRRSFITRSMRRPGEESGAAMPGVMPSLSEREEYAAPESEAATPEAAKGPQAPLTPEERLERFASAKACDTEFADPYLQRFSSLHREQMLHVWTNFVGQRVSASEARAAAEGVVQRGEEPAVPEGVVQDAIEYRPSTTLALVQRLCGDASLVRWREENGFPPLPSSWSADAVRGARKGESEAAKDAGGKSSASFRGASVPERMHCAVAQEMTVDAKTGLRRRASNLGEASKPRRSDDSSEDDSSSEEEEEGEDGEGAAFSAQQEAEAAGEVILRATALDESLQPHVAVGHLTSASHTSRQLLLIARMLLLWHQSREAPTRSGSWLAKTQSARKRWREDLSVFARLPVSVFDSLTHEVKRDAEKMGVVAQRVAEAAAASLAESSRRYESVILWRLLPMHTLRTMWDHFRATRLWALPPMGVAEAKWQKKPEFMAVRQGNLTKDLLKVGGKDGMTEEEVRREVRQMQRKLKRHNKFLSLSFRHYNTMAGGDDGGATMSQSAFRRMCQDCRVLPSKILNANLSLIFQKATQDADPSRGARGVMMPGDFVLGLIRLAVLRYPKVRPFSRKLDMLMDQYILRFAKHTDSSHFRAYVQDPDVQRVVARYEGDVKRIFDHFMMADAGNAMSAGSDAMNYREFTLLLKAANLFDARLTQQAAKLVFAHSQMEDEEMGGEDAGGDADMVLEELVEALCAVGVYRNPDPYIPFSRRLEQLMTSQIVPACKQLTM